MVTDGIRGPSPFDSDAAADESFDPLFHIIASNVRRTYAGTVIGPADFDDLTQEVSINVWLYSLAHPIAHPGAFVRRTAHNVSVDLQRKFKPSLSQAFPEDGEGETLEDMLLWRETSLENDPEWCALNNEGAAEMTERMADAIAGLSPCQQEATLCTLRPRVDNWQRLVSALEARGINADVEWSDDPEEKRRLQASFSPARRNIAHSMDENLSQYRRP